MEDFFCQMIVYRYTAKGWDFSVFQRKLPNFPTGRLDISNLMFHKTSASYETVFEFYYTDRNCHLRLSTFEQCRHICFAKKTTKNCAAMLAIFYIVWREPLCTEIVPCFGILYQRTLVKQMSSWCVCFLLLTDLVNCYVTTWQAGSKAGKYVIFTVLALCYEGSSLRLHVY